VLGFWMKIKSVNLNFIHNLSLQKLFSD